MEEKFLPIGTVVELQGGEGRVMIAGYCPTGQARPGYVWDYSGFLFPIGYQAANQIVQFDKEQISRVLGMGYQDEEQLDFMERLMPEAESVKANNKTVAAAEVEKED